MADKVFELEQVLMYRREMEKLRKQEFAAAKHGLEQANQELERKEAYVRNLTQEFNRCQHNFECIDEIRMYSAYFDRKQVEIEQQKDHIEYLDQLTAEKRSDLMEASKEKKMLETLKEKKTTEFRQDIATKERNFLDEISVQKKVNPA